MFEIRVVMDELDYDALADVLLPILAGKMEEKGGFRALLAKNSDALSGLARQWLSSMSQEKKDELLLQLLSDKKEFILTKANEAAARRGLGTKVLGMEVKKL